MTLLQAARELGLTPDLARAVAANPPPTALIGRPLIAADLDRTLIYSAAALGLGTAGASPPRLVVAELRDGLPLSYYTHAADRILEALGQAFPLVPVTTRTVAQFRRVRLTGRPPRFAVIANGGHLLIDGKPDTEWAHHVTSRIAGACVSMDEVHAHLTAIADSSWLLRLHTAEDLFCYAIVDRDQLPPSLMDDLTAWSASRGWTTSLQGRKLYCLPAPLTKEAAVAEIGRRVGGDLMIAAGDSLLDQGLLVASAAGIRPAHGELHDRGWQPDRIAVTTTAGVLAGAEIAAFLLACALSATGG
jgi:hypothetical protein